MNSREITEIAVKIKSVINTASEGALNKIAAQLETAVTHPNGILDQSAIDSMKRDSSGHYTINLNDTDIVKNVKATINLLRSIDAAIPTVINPAITSIVNYAETGSKIGLAGNVVSTISGVASSYIGAKWSGIKSAVDSAFNPFSYFSDDDGPNYGAGSKHAINHISDLISDVSAFKFQIGQFDISALGLNGLSAEASSTISRLQGALKDSSILNAATMVQDISDTRNTMGGTFDIANTVAAKQSETSLDRTLVSVKEAAGMHISAEDRKKYYDAKSDRFTIPDGEMPKSMNLMIAYNISDRARKTVDHINEFMDTWAKNGSFPTSQLPAMIELLNKVGKMIKDLQSMDNKQISDLIKKDMNAAIKEILGALAPNLQQLAMIAQESELRLGLKDNSILSNLQDIAVNFEKQAKNYNVLLTTKFPFPEQKNEVIRKIKGETEQRATMLASIKASMNISHKEVPSLSTLITMREQAKHIRSPAGSEYHELVKQMITSVTGMDKLDADINKAEAKLFAHCQIPQDKQKPDHVFEKEKLLTAIKSLYEMKDEIQRGIDNAVKPDSVYKHYISDKSGVGGLDYGSANVKLPKNLNAVAGKAAADVTVLINADKANIARMDTLLKSNIASMDTSKEIKTNRLQAVKNIGGETIRSGKDNERQRRADLQAATSRIQKTSAPDYAALEQTVINKKKGGVILQSESARQTLLNNAKAYLSPEQFKLLGNENKKNGLYTPDKNDSLLVTNIKQMTNTLMRLEGLMTTVNKIMEHANAGGMEYAKLVGQLPQVKSDITNLMAEMKALNSSLQEMRASLSNTAFQQTGGELNNIFSDINKNFPAKLLQLSNDAETNVLSNIDPSYGKMTADLFKMGNDFVKNIDHFVRSPGNDGPSSPAITASSSPNSPRRKESELLSNMISKLEKQVPGSPERDRGSKLYNLAKLQDGTPQKQAAGLVNALTSLNNSIAALVNISEGKSVTGGAQLMKELYAVYDAIAKANPSVLTGMSGEIKSLLEYMEPTIAKLYASAAFNELALGLKQGTLTAQLDKVVDPYIALATKYGADLKGTKPYIPEQKGLANKEMIRIESQMKAPGADNAAISDRVSRLHEIQNHLAIKNISTPEHRSPASSRP